MASVLSIGASLLGGLFSRNSAKKARAQALEDEKQKFVRLREAAELGGFNPLTALQYSGAGFGSNTPTGAAPLASIEMVQNAITDFGQIVTGEESKRRAREQLETDLLKIQLDQANHSAARAVAPGLPSVGRSGVSSTTQAVSSPYGKFTVDSATGRQSIMAGGVRVNPHLGWDNAEDLEIRYGDLGSSIYGLGVAAADFHNTHIKPRQEAAEAERKRLNPLGLPPLQVHNFGIPRAYQTPAVTSSFWDYMRGNIKGYPALRMN